MIKGEFINGCGQFHLNLKQFESIFNCQMIGSFNIKTEIPITKFIPAFSLSTPFDHPKATGGQLYWLLKLNRKYYGWAVRWGGSRQRETVWEVLSKEAFPDELKRGPIEIEVMEPWPPEKIKAWDKKVYQWQTFPFTSIPRADSAMVWDHINSRGDWPGSSVLDIGCNFGFHSQMASKAGAAVIGYDLNKNVLAHARAINDHIMMGDCQFQGDLPVGIFDYVLYLSVHHQADPEYERLERKMKQLQGMAKRKIFIELIIPAFNRGLKENEIDAIMGGAGFLRYRHKIRAIRKIYEIKGEAE